MRLRKVRILLALALFTGGPLAGQVAPPKPPGLPAPPNIAPLDKAADPLTISADHTPPAPNFVPIGAACPTPQLRFNSQGGYSPISWSVTSPTAHPWILTLPGGAAPPVAPASSAPVNPIGLKPSGQTSRILTLGNGDRNQAHGSHGFTLTVVDGGGNKRETTYGIHGTLACRTPALTNVSTGVPPATPWITEAFYSVHATDFSLADGRRRAYPPDSRIECIYPDGTKVICHDGQANSILNSGFSTVEQPPCSAQSPCAVKMPNYRGSGPHRIRLINPYGASADVSITPEFPSRSFTESETFVLPATITKTAATVTGTIDSAGTLNSPGCNGRVLHWRSVTFSDPSGRAKLVRTVRAGEQVTPDTMPQWLIAPGDPQVTFQVTYEVEARKPICTSLIIG